MTLKLTQKNNFGQKSYVSGYILTSVIWTNVRSFFLILETYFRKFSICQKLLEHGTFNRFIIFFSKRDTERDIDTVYLVASTTESLNLFENRSKITPNNRTIPINILARYQKLPQIWQQLNFRFQLSNLSRIIRFRSRSRPRK